MATVNASIIAVADLFCRKADMIDLTNAWVYDVETFPNVFTLSAERLYSDDELFFEISEYRDDRRALILWFMELQRNQTPMIGFNIIHFDYTIIHFIYSNPDCTPTQIYQKAQEIFAAFGFGENARFQHVIWQRDRLAPQIDLFKINHFDNKAKTTSLKALQINMRLPLVVDMPVEIGKPLTQYETEYLVKPYNKHDVKSTKAFTFCCMTAIQFRIGLTEQIRGDILNFNDTKIGETLLEQRIGEQITHERTWISTGFNGEGYTKKVKRQTIRSRIALSEIIVPYVQFNNPEFARVLDWMKQQVLTPEDLTDPDAMIQTKGVFKGVNANVGGLTFHFGTGGIHASVPPMRVHSSPTHSIEDIDVAGLYPAFAIANKLAPAHLGEAYVREYSQLPIERKEWQKKKGKKCVEANSLKLAGNGVYGKSNSPFSIFYDPQYTMAVTINCQLLLCMLAEWLLTVPTIKLIQANTDGITYYIQNEYKPMAAEIRKRWEQYTCLTLEDVEYKSMFIRDVNNYVAVPIKGELKQKGAYWHPDPHNYAESISEAQPPAWHKDLGNCISIRAAVAAMVQNIDPETFIRCATDPYDFMLRAKVDKASHLMLGNRELQRTSRYYVAVNGEQLRKISPPTGPLGEFKKANSIGEYEYNRVMKEIGPGKHDPRIHTKNKSKYEPRIMAFESGYKVVECNDVRSFDFSNVDYSYYANEARKLIIQ